MPTCYKGKPDEVRALNTFIKLMRATDSISAELTRHVATAGLTLGQFGVLEALLHLGPMSQGDLCGKLLRSGSNITTVIDNLEKLGFVERIRRTDDRRIVDVSLTTKGRAAIAKLFPAHAKRIVELFSALSPANQQQLGHLCRTLGRSLSRTGGDT
jgi:MarR family 2-MHQ and catechol resistance regulon transcriptional repressor